MVTEEEKTREWVEGLGQRKNKRNEWEEERKIKGLWIRVGGQKNSVRVYRNN